MSRQLPGFNEVPTLWSACHVVVRSNRAEGYPSHRLAQEIGSCRDQQALHATCARLILQDENRQDLYKAFVLDRHTNLLTMEDLICAYGTQYGLSAAVVAASCERAKEFDSWVGFKRWTATAADSDNHPVDEGTSARRPSKNALAGSASLPVQAEALLDAFATYRTARQGFLQQIECAASNRDPLAEFSERLVAQLVHGVLADNPVQKDYDVIGPWRECIQVKYLANPRGTWINEHHIQFHGEMDRYAIVFFEGLHPTLVLIFPRAGLETICQHLDKRHPDQVTTLQLTQRNVNAIAQSRQTFEELGVQVMPLA